jgi:hypothetical protein
MTPASVLGPPGVIGSCAYTRASAVSETSSAPARSKTEVTHERGKDSPLGTGETIRPGTPMLTDRLTTVWPEVTLPPQALDVTPTYRVAAAPALAQPWSPPAHAAPSTTPSRTRGGTAGVTCRGRARCRWRTLACSSWTNSRSSSVMCSRSYANRLRTTSLQNSSL